MSVIPFGCGTKALKCGAILSDVFEKVSGSKQGFRECFGYGPLEDWF